MENLQCVGTRLRVLEYDIVALPWALFGMNDVHVMSTETTLRIMAHTYPGNGPDVKHQSTPPEHEPTLIAVEQLPGHWRGLLSIMVVQLRMLSVRWASPKFDAHALMLCCIGEKYPNARPICLLDTTWDGVSNNEVVRKKA